MERNGAVPHHLLWPEPGELPSGEDRQLEKAINSSAGGCGQVAKTPAAEVDAGQSAGTVDMPKKKKAAKRKPREARHKESHNKEARPYKKKTAGKKKAKARKLTKKKTPAKKSATRKKKAAPSLGRPKVHGRREALLALQRRIIMHAKSLHSCRWKR